MITVNNKTWMYCAAVIAIPTAALFKSLIALAIPLYFLAILLVFIDPYFKALKSQLPSAQKYIVVVLSSGSVAGLITNIYPQTQPWLVTAWFLFFFLYGWPIASKIDRTHGS